MHSKKISIDSNVLNALEKDSQLFEKFLKYLRDNSLQFACTMDMAMENLLGQNFEAIWNRYQILCEISSQLSNSFLIIPLTQDSILKEIKHSRITKAFPAPNQEKIIQTWTSKTKINQQFNCSRSDALETRHKLKNTSNTVKLLRATQDPSELMRFEINKYSGITSSKLTIFISQKSLEAFKLQSSRRLVKSIAYNDKAYSVTKSYLNIILIKDMLAHISDNSFPKGLERAQSVRDSDTIDILIATASTFADFFITEDKPLKQLLNFLFSRQLIKTETLSLNEFLSK